MKTQNHENSIKNYLFIYAFRLSWRYIRERETYTRNRIQSYKALVHQK